jgi:hypothetical protein
MLCCEECGATDVHSVLRCVATNKKKIAVMGFIKHERGSNPDIANNGRYFKYSFSFINVPILANIAY